MIAAVVPLYFAVGLAFCYISAFHAPTPHHVEVAVVGSSVQTAPVAQALRASVGDQFVVEELTSQTVAEHAVANETLSGAFVVGQPPTAIVAGEAGVYLDDTVQALFRQVAAESGQPLQVNDVRPLPPGNASGTAIFYLLIACSFAGYFTVFYVGQRAPDLPNRQRLGLIAVMAVVVPIVTYLIGGVWFGALAGDTTGGEVAMVGAAMLYTLCVGLVARAIQMAFGTAAIYPMLLLLILLNFPSSGGFIPGSMLPAFWASLNHFWIGAAAVDAFRSLLYFNGAHVWWDLLVGWTTAVLAILNLYIAKPWAHASRGSLGVADAAAAAADSQ